MHSSTIPYHTIPYSDYIRVSAFLKLFLQFVTINVFYFVLFIKTIIAPCMSISFLFCCEEKRKEIDERKEKHAVKWITTTTLARCKTAGAVYVFCYFLPSPLEGEG